MKKTILTIIAIILTSFVFTQDSLRDTQFIIDSLEKSFTYEYGTIQLRNGIGQIIIPEGFKYLNATQSERLLVDLWGNPKSANLTLGMILPENQGVMDSNSYVFNIQYDEMGYVKDNDADDIDYDDLITQMQKDTEEENKERINLGYEPISLVGWAAKPFYDKDKKVLHWAKELKFGNSDINTLNYNVRVLGRKGVLVLNAISTMEYLTTVQQDIPQVMDIVQFSEGYRYEDFDSSIDEVAAWTIGGLVAGKILTKVGFFAILLKFWKIIAIAIAGSASVWWKKLLGKKENKPDENSSESTATENV